MNKFYKKPESVLVVIFTTQQEFLLMERADYPTFWQSVTGSMENNETPKETAIREVFEETNLDILSSAKHFKLIDCHKKNNYEIFPQFRHKYPPNTIFNTEHVFMLEINHELKQHVRISPNEHLNFDWFSYQDAILKAFSPSNRQALIDLDFK